MSAAQVSFDREHQAVRELLAFHANGTLSELEQARVTRHLAECTSCRDAAGAEQRLAQLIRARAGRNADVEAAWSRIERRLDALRPARRDWRRVAWPAAGLAAASLAFLVFLITREALLDPGAAYRTALDPETLALPADAQVIRVVFAPQATEASIRELLARTHCQIVSGPTPHGVYILAVSSTAPDRANGALAELRASPLVVFGEPLRP